MDSTNFRMKTPVKIVVLLRDTKNYKINCKLIFGSWLSCLAASAKKNEAPLNTPDHMVPISEAHTTSKFLAIIRTTKKSRALFFSKAVNL